MVVSVGGLYIEKRPLNGNASLSWDIARHLYARQLKGMVIVLADNPAGLLAATRKQWVKLTRWVRRERASTLDATLILELTNKVGRMQNARFVAKPPSEARDAEVYFMSDDQLLAVPFDCLTFYVACKLNNKRLAAIQEAMPYQSLLVIYT